MRLYVILLVSYLDGNDHLTIVPVESEIDLNSSLPNSLFTATENIPVKCMTSEEQASKADLKGYTFVIMFDQTPNQQFFVTC